MPSIIHGCTTSPQKNLQLWPPVTSIILKPWPTTHIPKVCITRIHYTIAWVDGKGGEASTKLMKAQMFNMLQTWHSDLNLGQSQRERNKDKKERGGENEQLREGLKPTTWQMACHALTNWSSESLGTSVVEFGWPVRDPAKADTKLACLLERVWWVQGARRLGGV